MREPHGKVPAPWAAPEVWSRVVAPPACSPAGRGTTMEAFDCAVSGAAGHRTPDFMTARYQYTNRPQHRITPHNKTSANWSCGVKLGTVALFCRAVDQKWATGGEQGTEGTKARMPGVSWHGQHASTTGWILRAPCRQEVRCYLEA